MLPQEIIRQKRDGATLAADELEFFVRGIADGSISEGQVAAFAMAVFLRGMSAAETVALTRAMTRSGTVLDWDLPGPVLDKHSTGGVGDKVSLVLAPIVAACGGFVPMISGRGLGHTGGTLDKLDSIPGYRSQPDLHLFRRVVGEAGCAIIGQTADLAPADRRLYAVRDVTATVESIPLITASILSKKLAAGLQGLVMDVKFGSGAFMAEKSAARDLARSIVDVATGAGLPTVAFLTDMNEVLGTRAGNALEVTEALAFLTGASREQRLLDVTLALAADMLVLGGIERDPATARQRAQIALDSGDAAERFQRMAAALGGPTDLLEKPAAYLPAAPHVVPAAPTRPGFVARIDVRQVGIAIILLGGGRRRAEDAIDHAVGLSEIAPLGARVDSERPLALVHARSADDAAQAAKALQSAFVIAEEAPVQRPVVDDRIVASEATR
jgi:thymidine phosphorylase